MQGQDHAPETNAPVNSAWSCQRLKFLCVKNDALGHIIAGLELHREVDNSPM